MAPTEGPAPSAGLGLAGAAGRLLDWRRSLAMMSSALGGAAIALRARGAKCPTTTSW